MQRIKSQSTCLPASSLMTQPRAQSKKSHKGQTLDYSYNAGNKHKNGNITNEHSMTSLKTTSKTLTGSMKNLKLVQYQCSTAKNSVQNTSRQANTNSAVSARILKQIVGYRNQGKKPKEAGKQTQAIRLQIDLDNEIENMCANVDKSSKRTSENLKSHQTQTRHSSNGKISQENKQKNSKREHRVQEFQPVIEKPRKSINLLDGKENERKPSFFGENHSESHRLNGVFNESKEKKSNKQSVVEHQQQRSIAQIPNQFMEILSPNYASFKKSKYCTQSNQLLIEKDTKQKQKKSVRNSIGKINDFQGQIQCKSRNDLQKQKQNLIISLQQSTAVIEEHFEHNYKELIPYWKGLIESESKKKSVQYQLQQLQHKIAELTSLSSTKKTQLFELNRDQICRKKQKLYISNSSKERCIQQAIAAQEELRLKLSSKVDYEHIILFNLKVILTGQTSIQQLYEVYEELFNGKLSKKFALIAKKQLTNLSVYDSRLVQDFLKRIQQLESGYGKMVSQSEKTNALAQYSSLDEQAKLQQLVQQIQQLTLQIEFFISEKVSKMAEMQQIDINIQYSNKEIRNYILNTNKRVSGEYKMTEGCSFDFELMLEEKFTSQFELYRKEIIYKEEILQKIALLQKKINEEKFSCFQSRRENDHSIKIDQIQANSSQKFSSYNSSGRQFISIRETPSKNSDKLSNQTFIASNTNPFFKKQPFQ